MSSFILSISDLHFNQVSQPEPRISLSRQTRPQLIPRTGEGARPDSHRNRSFFGTERPGVPYLAAAKNPWERHRAKSAREQGLCLLSTLSTNTHTHTQRRSGRMGCILHETKVFCLTAWKMSTAASRFRHLVVKKEAPRCEEFSRFTEWGSRSGLWGEQCGFHPQRPL